LGQARRVITTDGFECRFRFELHDRPPSCLGEVSKAHPARYGRRLP
jgi:hypothetical protein